MDLFTQDKDGVVQVFTLYSKIKTYSNYKSSKFDNNKSNRSLAETLSMLRVNGDMRR